MGLRKLLSRLWHLHPIRPKCSLEVAADSIPIRENAAINHGKPTDTGGWNSRTIYKSSTTEDRPVDVIQQPVSGSSHPLSAIEKLPTELLQHIASYLLCDYPAVEEDLLFADFTTCPGFDGLMEFRETSRTIHVKTEFTFASCFETHALSFTDGSILGLLEMSYHEGIRFRMRSLIFMAPDLAHKYRCQIDTPEHRRRLDAIAQLPDVQKLLPCYPISTVLITAALKRLRLTSIIVAPSLVTTHNDGYRKSKVPKDANSPTSIFNAAILSKIRLERLEMSMLDWGTYEGMQPDKTCLYQIYDRSLAHLEAMTSLTLVLDDPRLLYKTRFQKRTVATLDTLSDMLSKCYNLRYLNLGLDKRTIDDDWPYLGNALQVWQAITTIRYWTLRTLKLSGFVLDPQTLHEFLDKHKLPVQSLHFNNCHLAGSWEDTLGPLRTAPELRTVVLDQVSEELQRIVWSVPCSHDLLNMDETLADKEEDEDWVRVICVGCPGVTLDFIGRDVDEHMSEVFENLRVSHRTADPSALDALYWYSDYLAF